MADEPVIEYPVRELLRDIRSEVNDGLREQNVVLGRIEGKLDDKADRKWVNELDAASRVRHDELAGRVHTLEMSDAERKVASDAHRDHAQTDSQRRQRRWNIALAAAAAGSSIALVVVSVVR